MSCRHYRRLLHLHRPGELSAREQAALAKHIAACSSCAAELREILATDRLVSHIRSQEPAAGEPDTITPRVLSAINRQATATHRGETPGIGNRLADLVFAPASRIATVTLATACVLLLFTQVAATLGSVSSLERTIAVPLPSPKLAYVVGPDIIARQPALRPFWSLAVSKSSFRMNNGFAVPFSAIRPHLTGAEAMAMVTGTRWAGITALRIGQLLSTIQRTSEITVLFDTKGR